MWKNIANYYYIISIQRQANPQAMGQRDTGCPQIMKDEVFEGGSILRHPVF